MKSFQNLFLASLISFSVVVSKPTVVQSDIFYEISKGNVSAVRVWLKTKPDLSIKNDKGQTLLGAAVCAGKRSLVQALIKAGANVNALDSAHKTALDHAVESDNVKIAAILAKYNGKVTIAENMYRFKDLMRAYANKLFIRAWIIGIVTAIVLPLLWTACLSLSASICGCKSMMGGCVCGLPVAITLISASFVVSIYEIILIPRAISWNRVANRFDDLLTNAVIEPVVILEK